MHKWRCKNCRKLVEGKLMYIEELKRSGIVCTNCGHVIFAPYW